MVQVELANRKTIPVPESREALREIVKKGGIAKHSWCGAFYLTRWNEIKGTFEAAPIKMNGRFDATNEIGDWYDTDDVPDDYNVKEVFAAPEAEPKNDASGPIRLGARVRDRVHGLRGVAIGRTEMLYGATRILVGPEKAPVRFGEPIAEYHVEETRLEMVE